MRDKIMFYALYAGGILLAVSLLIYFGLNGGTDKECNSGFATHYQSVILKKDVAMQKMLFDAVSTVKPATSITIKKVLGWKNKSAVLMDVKYENGEEDEVVCLSKMSREQTFVHTAASFALFKTDFKQLDSYGMYDFDSEDAIDVNVKYSGRHNKWAK